MSFKNALKNLVAHFGTVWALLLYIVVFAALITGLSLPFVLPIARAFDDAGVFSSAREAFSALFGEGGWQGMLDGLYAMYNAVVDVFVNNDRMVSLTTAFLIFVVIVAVRFFFGLHEIPMATVLDGQLSSNAHYGFGGKFVSTLWMSMRFSLAKMLFTVVFDAIIGAVIYGIAVGMGFNVALPFVLIFVALVFISLRYSLCACWTSSIVCDGYGVIKGFARSVKICFIRFGTIYSSYFVAFIIIMALGMFITIFTVGVGLIIVFPLFATFISYLNITVYYNKTGKRYYIDGAVFTPPYENGI